ncbi:unnamed protein product [Sympodiomycopsis kandeliae]
MRRVSWPRLRLPIAVPRFLTPLIPLIPSNISLLSVITDSYVANMSNPKSGNYPTPPQYQANSDVPYEVDADVDEDPRYATTSYQSGQQQQQQPQPHQQQYSTSASFQPPISVSNSNQYYPSSSSQPDHASYVTSRGISLSVLCQIAWLFPPFTGVVVLILETHNILPDRIWLDFMHTNHHSVE